MNQTQQTEDFQTIKARYKKANSSYKQKILRKYGVSNIDRVEQVLAPKNKEVKCTMNELAMTLLNHPAVELTVSFNKQLSLDTLLGQVMDVYNYSSPSQVSSSFRTCLKKAIEGEVRVAKGRHNGKKDFASRLYFTETTVPLDKSKNYDNRMILISLNHLNWMEIGNVKYSLK